MLRYIFLDARFFLIKSSNHENVALAQAKGVWSSTPPIEARLNQAFRVRAVACLWLVHLDLTIFCWLNWYWRPRHKRSNGVRRWTVDEERMRPGHWLGLVPCVPFFALTLMVGWQGHRAHKTPHSTNLHKFSSRTGEGATRAHTHAHTTILRPFFAGLPGEPVPEEIFFWTLWCKGGYQRQTHQWSSWAPLHLD